LTAEVRRKAQIHVQAFDLEGQELDFDADGMLSICIQHEIDHLNGVCFVDRLSPVKRKLVVRDYLREQDLDRREEAYRSIRSVHETE
jgi:peptide deformylase